MLNPGAYRTFPLCLFLSVPSVLCFAALARAEMKIVEQEDRIEAAEATYTLIVYKRPLQWVVKREGQVVLATEGPFSGANGTVMGGRAGGPIGFVTAGGSTRAITHLISHNVRGNVLELRAGTSRHNWTLMYSVEMAAAEFKVHAKVEGAEKVERITQAFKLSSGGHWYGGAVDHAHLWPLEAHSWSADPMLANSNQATPFWMASSGVGIWLDTYDDIAVSFNKDNDRQLRIAYLHSPEMHYTVFVGKNIAEARDLFAAAVGKPKQRPPDYVFERPIWGTWCQYFAKVTQRDVIAYARKLHDGGWPASFLIIDDGWQTHYGDNEFNSKFPNPKAMTDEIHGLGYKLVLWVENFANPDSDRYRRGQDGPGLIRDAATGLPARIRWWNGEAALMDLNDRFTRDDYVNGLKGLMRRYGVDGFKFDGGDAGYWPAGGGVSSAGPIKRNRYTDLWAEIGSEFELNELRVGWRSQPLGVLNRMRDKRASWNEADGMPAIISHGGIQSLLGFVFNCPDLIGGGLDEGFKPDEELNVRWTEAAAFMPIMQFSYGPWQFSENAQKIIRRFALLHGKLWHSHLKALVERAVQTGKPIWSPLFYVFPEDEKSYLIRDEFMVGERLLVAPVVAPGARARDVYLPPGKWRDFWSEKTVEGGRVLTNYPAPLERIPVFELVK
ncbi:MAG: glycoside hydrolase family 31 protein [Terriglobia bacterium]